MFTEGEEMSPLCGAYRKAPLIWASCDSVGVHVAAHLVNALNFSVNYSEDFAELNAARYPDEVGGLPLLIFLSLVVR